MLNILFLILKSKNNLNDISTMAKMIKKLMLMLLNKYWVQVLIFTRNGEYLRWCEYCSLFTSSYYLISLINPHL